MSTTQISQGNDSLGNTTTLLRSEQSLPVEIPERDAFLARFPNLTPVKGSLAPAPNAKLPTTERVSQVQMRSTPIQIWEGRVIAVDRASQAIQVKLTAKLWSVHDHARRI